MHVPSRHYWANMQIYIIIIISLFSLHIFLFLFIIIFHFKPPTSKSLMTIWLNCILHSYVVVCVHGASTPKHTVYIGCADSICILYYIYKQGSARAFAYHFIQWTEMAFEADQSQRHTQYWLRSDSLRSDKYMQM